MRHTIKPAFKIVKVKCQFQTSSTLKENARKGGLHPGKVQEVSQGLFSETLRDITAETQHIAEFTFAQDPRIEEKVFDLTML